MGNLPLSGQGVSESHERDVQGVESTDGRPNKLAEEIRDNPSNPTPSHTLALAVGGTAQLVGLHPAVFSGNNSLF